MTTQAIGFDIFARDRGASATFDKVGRKVGATTSFFEKHKTAILGGAAIAGAAVVKFGTDSVAAYVDAEKSQRVLEDAYKRFPALADMSIDALRDQAAALQNKTKFDGDNINAMQGSLAAYKLTGTQISQLTPLVLDYAQKTGKDLPTAAAVVGKAMLGQGRALKDVGINFKDTGTQAGNFEQLVGGLRTQVGGFAEQEGKSTEGRLEILKNKFGDLQENIGSKLLPVGEELIGWAMQAVDWISQNSELVGKLAVGAGVLASALGTLLVVNKVTGAIKALSVVVSMNPLGLIITAAIALAAGLIYAYKNSETFRKVVDTAFKAIGSVARWLWNSVMAPVLRFMINGFATLVEWVASFLDGISNIPGFGWAKDAATKMRGAATAARNLAGNIKDIPDANVNVYVGMSGPGIALLYKQQARKNGDVLYGRAGGGSVRAGVPYLVGENPDGSMNDTSELFVSDTPGHILNARQTRAYIRQGGGPLGAGGGEFHVHVYIDGREVRHSLQRIDRQLG